MLDGKPSEIRVVLFVVEFTALVTPAGAAQPADVKTVPVKSTLVVQPSMKPGILPAIAVTWKVDSVSNNKAYPARTEVFLSGDHAMPKRGPTLVILSFWNQRSVFTNATGPWDPSGKTLGASVCCASYGAGLNSHRTPALRVRFGRSFHSS